MSNIIDLMPALRKRDAAKVVQRRRAPAVHALWKGGRVYLEGDKIVVELGVVEDNLIFSRSSAKLLSDTLRSFVRYFEREEYAAQRVAEGHCRSMFCKRKLVAGTQHCRKCAEAWRARKEGESR